MYIGDWMERAERYFPDNLAVVDIEKNERFSYREMNQRANQLASFLQDKVQKGDRVGILAQNGVEYLDLFFACAKLGVIFVPYNYRLHSEEIKQLVEETKPSVLFYEKAFDTAILCIEERCVWLRNFVYIDQKITTQGVSYQNILHSSHKQKIQTELLSKEDIACLLFTGGTTGQAKGAKISFRMIAWNTLNTVIHELNRDDITLTHTPMFHTGGLLVYTLPLLTLGGTVVITKKWDPEETLELIEKEHISVFFATPTHYQQMLSLPGFRNKNLSTLRYLTSGGAPLPISLIHTWQEIHPTPFKQGFGMTEFGPGVFSMSSEYAISKAGSIGKPNYFIDAKLVDEKDQEVKIGEVGELLLRGPAAFSGYFQAETNKVSHYETDWFHTGDMAYADNEGFYYIVDRKKDMFISGGENVYPAEIEKILYEHPAIYQCAVIGIPDPKWGEVGHAFLVCKKETNVTKENIKDFLQEKLAKYKIPKQIRFLESLPLSPVGKVSKKALRKESMEP